jgi:acyl-CoA hydrolase
MRTLTLDTLAAALPRLPETPRLVVSGNFAAPYAVLEALDRALPTYRLHALNAQPGLPDREGVTYETAFVGPGMRRSPRLRYIPSRLSLVPHLYAATCPPDLVVIHTSMPHDGMVSLGVEVNVMPAAIEAARDRGATVIAQLNPRMPYTFGDAEVSVEAIDLAVEVEASLPSPTPLPIDDISASIGERVAARVGDGSTLQLGIGAVPDAVLSGLTGRRGLRIWSEMFSDGVLELDRAGALDTDALLTSSFLFGSPELYDWVDRNPRVSMRRTETTNEPALIARNDLMTSVNTAIQVDLYAQANASRVRGQIFSGFGGQTDFIVGALHSRGGQAILALRSWHPKANVSTIVPMIDEPVTSFQASAIVTEHGQAWIWGYDQESQARHLIRDAAHPDVRDELYEEARALGLAR